MREIVHVQAALIAAAIAATTMVSGQDGTDAAPDTGSVVIVSDLVAQPAGD